MTDTKEPYNKSLALLTLGTIYDLADRHIDDSPAFHQVRLLSGDLGDLINADTVMVADPIVQEAVPVSDPEPWPIIPENAPFWYPADPGPNATRSIADLMNQLAHRPIPLTEAANHYRNIMVHVSEAVSEGAHSTAAIVTEQPAEGKVNMQPIPAQSDAFKMQPAPNSVPLMPVQLPGTAQTMAPHIPTESAVKRLREMIDRATGVNLSEDDARKIVSEIRVSDRAMEAISLLDALENTVNREGVEAVDVRKDRTLVRFTDPGKLSDVWMGKPREALKRVRSAQKPE